MVKRCFRDVLSECQINNPFRHLSWSRCLKYSILSPPPPSSKMRQSVDFLFTNREEVDVGTSDALNQCGPESEDYCENRPEPVPGNQYISVFREI